jgi:hypothetical protein
MKSATIPVILKTFDRLAVSPIGLYFAGFSISLTTPSSSIFLSSLMLAVLHPSGSHGTVYLYPV